MNYGKKLLQDASPFIGNEPAERGWIILAAAQRTGFAVAVYAEATDVHGRLVPGCVGVWTEEPRSRDHGPFWSEYRRILAAQRQW